ncbi:MAG: phage late control D family protein [Peptococcaceae bacterium]|nr:phage late control D family protein [Peptococcaceae bacterium]
MDAPRAIVEVAGVDVSWYDLIDLSFENTLYLAADSFEATFRNDKNLSDWFRKLQEVKIYLGYVKYPEAWSKAELNHVFTGRIDGVKPKFGSSRTVQLIGRDYSAPMIDTEYSVSYAECTSSQIAAILAEKYGLTPLVTETTVIVDKELVANKKEWDVLQALADLEGFVCYVTKDKELYFGPRQDADDDTVAVLNYRLPGLANCEIDFDDSVVGVVNKVTVRHWREKDKQLIEASAVNRQVLDAMGGQVKERIIYESKAKTYELAQMYAEKRLKELSRIVVTASGNCPGNEKMAAEKKVLVAGCGRFDETYYIEKVTHRLSKQEGYKTTFDITSIRPETAEQYRQDLYDYKEKTA